MHAARKLPEEARRALEAIVGSHGLIEDPGRLLAYEADALTTRKGTPLAVVLPDSREALIDTIHALNASELPFVPRGAGTGLSGGSVAHDAVVVSTTRLRGMIELDPVNRTAWVESGVITAEISVAAAAHGLRYLPDPASAIACTIGGNIAMNSGGPHCLKHGVTSDHVLGLEIVLPDGATAWLGRGQDGGLDLAGLFIGSEGTMGLVSSALVALEPVADTTRAMLGLFDGVGEAGAAVSDVFERGLVPVALELIDRATIEVVEASIFAAGLPTDTEAALVIECEGCAEEVEAALAIAAEACRANGAREVRIAEDEEQRLAIWQARKKAYGALGRAAPDVFVQDAVVPRTELVRVLPEIRRIADSQGLRLANFFHAGDGNLHPNLLFDRRNPDEVARVEEAGEAIMRLCVEAGGTITGEHGVGCDKVRHMPLLFGPGELALMRSLHTAFDPDDLANPDKMLPDTRGAEAAK
ncbi:MAG: FAD-linked oxidase C-terminal domain-containing protein [Gemmatimonadota bacterium]